MSHPVNNNPRPKSWEERRRMKIIKTTAIPLCPELRGSLIGIKYPVLAEVKIDGEFAFVHARARGDCFTVNKYGKIRTDFPDLDFVQAMLKKSNHQSATFLAELYFSDGKNGSFYQFLANKESDDLRLYIHDIMELDSTDLRNEDLIDRKEILTGTIHELAISCKVINNETEAMNYFKYITSSGYEGIVLKPLNSKIVLGPCAWVKVKYKDQTDYQIQLIDSNQERIEVTVPVIYTTPTSPSTTYPNYVMVGVKAANKYKKYLKVGMMVTIEHQGVLPGGSLRHPVLIPKPEWK